ncbi:CsbD family protein [Uliginosibacterium sp. H1]|uniref:CsbD family protein n=1 Tax=Uliginosibacterium sp. H1 TaxID=3114757 RepID=UPI002E1906F6|nr:CsbD family protein [Uliginosibacterium sp. H1]
MMNKDQVMGRANYFTGKVKEATGSLIGNSGMQVRGRADQIAGQARAAIGDAEQRLKLRLRAL